jgi:hypothetical protein
MQKYLRTLLIFGAIFMPFSIILGCAKEAEALHSDKENGKHPLELIVVDSEDRIMVLVANTSVDQIIINKLLRANGDKPELTFFFDGKLPQFNRSRTAFIQLEDLDDARHELAPEEVTGVYIRKSDLLSMFVINSNSSKDLVVSYKDMLNVQDAYSQELKSSSVKVCFN